MRKRTSYTKQQLRAAQTSFFYLGSTSSKSITRFHIHFHSLRHRDSKNGTALSKKVWELRDRGLNPSVHYSVHAEAESASTCSKKCRLCLGEKRAILFEESELLLNSRVEIFSRCRHRVRWKVVKFMP